MTETGMEKKKKTLNDRYVSVRLAIIGWGLFLAWIGFVSMIGLPPGAGLTGVGLIALGIQGIRKAFALPLEGLWCAVGVICFAGGLWSLAGVDLPILPILVALSGLALVLFGIKGLLSQRSREG